MEEEKWSTIEGFDYQISNMGNIKNIKTGKNLSKTYRGGYLRVKLHSVKSVAKTLSVHKLVASCFLPAPDENKTQINHINGIKDDNRYSNLEWVSQSENILHAQDNNLMEKFNRKVKQYDLDGNFLKEFNSVSEAEKELKISRSIWHGCTLNMVIGGFRWKYSEDFSTIVENDGEIWKQYKDSLYEISNFGRVKSTRNVIKRLSEKDGRLCTSLSINKKSSFFQVARLVAETFLPNPNNLKQVDHIDKNVSNNHVSNLRWISPEENIRHTFSKKINQYDLKGALLKTWDAMADISRELNISTGDISYVCNGTKGRKTAGGFKWSFQT